MDRHLGRSGGARSRKSRRARVTRGRLLLVLILVVASASCGPSSSPPSETVASTGVLWRSAYTDTNGTVADATYAGNTFVVAGANESGLRIWRSASGGEWRQVASTDIERSGPGLMSHALASRDSGFVLFGEDLHGAAISLAVWISRDGGAWTAIDSPAFHANGNLAAGDIVWSGHRFVAVGSEPKAEVVTPDAVVLISSDGRSWTRIRDKAFVSDAGLAMNSVTVWAGSVFAFGSEAPDGTAVLKSDDDGLTWTRSNPVALSTGTVIAASASSAGMVLGGCVQSANDGSGHDQAVVWIAPDGPAGTIQVKQLDNSSEKSCVYAVDATPHGLLAGGFLGAQPAVWDSADGTTWQRLDLPGADRLHQGVLHGIVHSQTLDLTVGDGRASSVGQLGTGPSSVEFWTREVRP